MFPSEPLSGELFAGAGGLGMAVDEVFGTRPGWFSEFDPAPSKVLAHHHPDVPNHGDVTKVNFRNLPHTHVRSGGFPCQDVSLAGRRRGMTESTRSGLWSEFARSIEEDRPDWVVIENVRGLLSADAASDVEPCPLCVGDNPGHVLRALGAVLGDLADLGFDAEWTGIRAADVGAPHGRFRVFILAWPRERTAADAVRESVRGRARGIPRAAGEVERHGDQRERSGRASRDSGTHAPVALLPTPTVGNATGGNAQRGGDRSGEKLLPGLAREHATDWGPYAAAVARWETVLGRPAPAPVRMDGKGGKARLNPELPEWMMGWPAGHVTHPAIGLTRAEQLKIAGNGAVPQQAAAALREMLARPGVPDIEWDTHVLAR
ncbi:DNA cytosine methyltransferase [Microbacterium gilvum]|uniref:DNA (cytosine-5-)-methyltransferase n=1 Tax=Microbacterium gilvum TaxID=1336204 RepID=A0ABP9A6P2_9MICO